MYHILFFINGIVFQNVGPLWLIKTKETNEFEFDKESPFWIQSVPW